LAVRESLEAAAGEEAGNVRVAMPRAKTAAEEDGSFFKSKS
jgi:hypothetical protein